MNLNDLVDKASEIHSQIKGINTLKQERAKIEVEIFEKLLEKGESFDNRALDYCFSLKFPRTQNINGKDVYKSAFDILPQVYLFFKMVEESKGNPILTMDEEVPVETGKISGECRVEIKKQGEHNHRELYVPVHPFLEYRISDNKWHSWAFKKGIFITPDIFLHPNKTNSNPYLNRAWQTDYSEDFFAGGKPKEKTIYIERTPFQENQDVTIRKEIIVPEPDYF